MLKYIYNSLLASDVHLHKRITLIKEIKCHEWIMNMDPILLNKLYDRHLLEIEHLKNLNKTKGR